LLINDTTRILKSIIVNNLKSRKISKEWGREQAFETTKMKIGLETGKHILRKIGAKPCWRRKGEKRRKERRYQKAKKPA